MVVVAAMTSLSAWIMRDIVNSVYLKRGFDVVLEIAFAVAAIFIVKGLATFVQSYYLSKAGNSIVAEQQRRIYDRLLKQGVSFSKPTFLRTSCARHLQCAGSPERHRHDRHLFCPGPFFRS